MRKKELGEPYRTTLLCVDSYQDGVLAGRFYNPSHEQCHSFQSLTQFLVEMEQRLDAMAFPQSFAAIRTFSSGTGTVVPWHNNVQNMQGELATFAIRILFRQNASWQGSVNWLEGRKEQSFRSVLELIFLIDSALGDIDKEAVG